MDSKLRASLLALVSLCMVPGCAPFETGGIEPAVLQETVAKDRTQVYQHGEISDKLKLEDALARALKYNLDTKVAEIDELIAADDVTLDMLNSLPSVTAKAQRVGRNNEGGSSSFSVLTGQETLEPSISTERYRNTQQLNVEWNLLEAGINLWRAKSTSDRMLIAQERRRKIYHSVLQDTYAAYWRAAAAQISLPMIDELLAGTNVQSERIAEQIKQGIVPLGDAQTARAALQDRRKKLQDMKQGLMLAGTELKTLIDYPVNQPLVLDLEGHDWLNAGALPGIKGSFDDFEKTAFTNRPEIREEVLNKSISQRDIKLSIIETIPGADLLFTYNYDSNKFLEYHKWVDGIVGLTQSINKIITAPARYQRAKDVDQLSDKRRQALVAAVITQIYVAKARYDFLAEGYTDSAQVAKDSHEVLARAQNFSSTGLMSEAELLNVKIDSSITAINKAIAYADAQDAYGRFVTTLGVDLWDADDAGLSVPDYAKQIKKNLTDENLFVLSSADGKVAP